MQPAPMIIVLRITRRRACVSFSSASSRVSSGSTMFVSALVGMRSGANSTSVAAMGA